MNTQRFDILGCAALGIRSVFAERRFLFAAALLPVGITAAIELLKVYGLEKQTILTELLTLLPVSAVTAWFMFLQTRLLVFGERPENVAPENVPARRRAFETSMLLWMLVQIAGLGLLAFMLHWTRQVHAGEAGGIVNVLGYLLIGASFWAVRLIVAHILGATGYSIRSYIFRVNGVMVSVRILALLLIVLLPIGLLAGPVEEALHGALKEDAAALYVSGLMLMRVILNFLLLAFFNAAAVFALRQMLGQDRPARGATA